MCVLFRNAPFPFLQGTAALKAGGLTPPSSCGGGAAAADRQLGMHEQGVRDCGFLASASYRDRLEAGVSTLAKRNGLHSKSAG